MPLLNVCINGFVVSVNFVPWCSAVDFGLNFTCKCLLSIVCVHVVVEADVSFAFCEVAPHLAFFSELLTQFLSRSGVKLGKLRWLP